MNLLFLAFALIAALFAGGCAARSQQVRVVTTPADSQVYRFTPEPGDVILCDKEACHVVRQ